MTVADLTIAQLRDILKLPSRVTALEELAKLAHVAIEHLASDVTRLEAERDEVRGRLAKIELMMGVGMGEKGEGVRS